MFGKISDDGNESSGQRLGQAIKFTGVFLVVFFITLTLMYAFLNQTQIPVTNMSLGHTEGIAGSATFPRRVVGQFGCLVRYVRLFRRLCTWHRKTQRSAAIHSMGIPSRE